jgi:hypothetical protein
MRRSIVAVVVATGLTLSVLSAGSPQATAADDPTPAGDRVAEGRAQQALATAEAAFADVAPDSVPGAARRTTAARPDATLALRDLFMTRTALSGGDRQRADGLLARPSDGSGDLYGDGYTVPAQQKCKKHFCIHWVTSTLDAPPSQAWVNTNLKLMNKVWKTEVQKLGYHAPISDKSRGGKKGKFDVYLKEVGSKGVYGYCAPERKTKKYKWLASGYCVLDNDFAAEQYGGAPPMNSLRVTAAHEFFHAVQFAYDYGEDGWMMESTATWMEERVADEVNDNRQYLASGQLGVPGSSLDVYDQQGYNQYGNWPFWEYLSNRFGKGIVKAIWTQAGEGKGASHDYSTKAVRKVLDSKGGFPKVFGAYAGGNTFPGQTYPEGGHWPAAPRVYTWSLTKASPGSAARIGVNHMSSRNVAVRPAADMTSKRWKLRIKIDGPQRKSSPTAYVIVKKKHGVDRHPISLGKKGKAKVELAFTAKRVESVVITLVNASTRFSCWKETASSCQGRARDNGAGFKLGVKAHQVKKKKHHHHGHHQH